MKGKKRSQAIFLRKEKGMSINVIAKEVGVAKSTASIWLRDIELTDEQKNNLDIRNPAKCQKMTTIFSKKCRDKRVEQQNNGRKKIKNSDSEEYAFGCALFWAEGNKEKNTIRFTNTDPLMMKFFVDFLKKYFNIKSDDIKLTVNCYLNNGLTVEDIQKYWMKLLGLSTESLRKFTLKSDYYSDTKSHKHPYGVARIVVHNTEVIQNMYGSVKEMIKDNSDMWID
jgi:hypothetical protein